MDLEELGNECDWDSFITYFLQIINKNIMLKILAIAQGTLWKKERKDCGSRELENTRRS